MPFKFRLERVLTIRRQALEDARLAVLAAENEVKKAHELVERLVQELKDMHNEMMANNYAMAQDYLRVIKQLDKRLEQAKKDLRARREELVQRKLELIEAHKKLEALEKLKERQAEEYKIEADRVEQIQTDERVTMKFAHEMLKEAEEHVETEDDAVYAG